MSDDPHCDCGNPAEHAWTDDEFNVPVLPLASKPDANTLVELSYVPVGYAPRPQCSCGRSGCERCPVGDTQSLLDQGFVVGFDGNSGDSGD